jgi:hypothetical protein
VNEKELIILAEFRIRMGVILLSFAFVIILFAFILPNPNKDEVFGYCGVEDGPRYATPNYSSEGGNLFYSNCSSCHKAAPRDHKLVGPGLKNARQTWKEKVKIPDLIYTYVRNPAKASATGDPYVKELLNYDGSAMVPQPLTNEEIDLIFDFIDGYTPY